jgi:hypothetical protein
LPHLRKLCALSSAGEPDANTNANSNPDTNAYSDTHFNANANANAYSDTYFNSDAHSNSDAYTNAHADSNPNAHPECRSIQCLELQRNRSLHHDHDYR